MKDRTRKIGLAIFLTIIFLILIIYLLLPKKKEYQSHLFYMDTYIDIKFETKKSGDQILEEIENIYRTYHELSDRYQEYRHNVYYLIHNEDATDSITIDSKLYELLEYAMSGYEKSGGRFDIHMGCVIDIWKKYRESGEGIPSEEELNSCDTNTKLTLLGNDQVLNNHANIDLGGIAKGYATEKVKEYLENKKIENYIINAGGNVIVGTPSDKEYYQVGIEDPNNGGVFKILKVNHKAIVTSGGYERFYEYEGKKYHHIIDPSTNFPSEYMKSVTIDADDSALADFLSTTLFLMTVEEGQEFIKNYPEVDVIWYTLDDQVISTEGIKQYE